MAVDLMVALVNSQVMQAGRKPGANRFPGRLDQPHDDIVASPGRGQFRHRAALDGVRLVGEVVEGGEPLDLEWTGAPWRSKRRHAVFLPSTTAE
jgi:hypothetical protein